MNNWRPALELRRKRDTYQALASLPAFLFFFSLVAAISSRQAFGGDMFQQSAQQSRNARSGGSDERDVRALEVGKPIRRELAGGQAHAYRIGLSSDQFMKVIVEQQGIDVVVQVSGPDGKQILEFDSESRTRGQEVVSQVAEAGGDYQLVVEPKLREAPAGAYEIRIEELRPTTENDRTLQESRNLYQKAFYLYRAGKYDEALPSFERALEIRERVLGPDHPEVIFAINGLATLQYFKGEYSKAELLFQRVLAAAEKSLGPEHPFAGNALHGLANTYYSIGEFAKAEPLFQRAVLIREKALGPEHPDVANSLNNLAGLYYYKGSWVMPPIIHNYQV